MEDFDRGYMGRCVRWPRDLSFIDFKSRNSGRVLSLNHELATRMVHLNFAGVFAICYLDNMMNK